MGKVRGKMVLGGVLTRHSVKVDLDLGLSNCQAHSINAMRQSRFQSPRYPYLAERECGPFRWPRVTRALGTRLAARRTEIILAKIRMRISTKRTLILV